MTTMNTAEEPSAERSGGTPTGDDAALSLLRLANGYQISQAISVAAMLNLADQFGPEPRTAGAVAEAIGVDSSALYRLLRALTTIGIFRETEDRRFTESEMSSFLRSDHPRSVRGWPAFVGRDYHWAAWGDLLNSVRTGENAMRRLYGMDVWEFRADKLEETTIFNAAMSALARHSLPAIVKAYDFDRFHRIVDVGGADGTLLSAILSSCPRPTGVVFDLPHVVREATPVIERAGLGARCEIAGGSYFDAVPAGGDLYILKSVLMDCTDEECALILRKVREATGDTGTVLVIEVMIGPPNEGQPAAFSDLNMLVVTGGRGRGEDDWRGVFSDAGLELSSVRPAGPRFSLIEGRPAGFAT